MDYMCNHALITHRLLLLEAVSDLIFFESPNMKHIGCASA